MIMFTGGLTGSLDRDAESVLLPADVVDVGVEAPDPDDAVEEVAYVGVVDHDRPYDETAGGWDALSGHVSSGTPSASR